LIFIALDEKDYPSLVKLLKTTKLKDLHSFNNRSVGHFLLYEDKIETHQLLKGLNSIKIPSLSWDISRIENYYTNKEILSFPFHHIMAESFVEVSKRKEKEIYDYSNACSECGWGRKQRNDLILRDIRKIDRIHFTKTYDFEYIVSRSLGNFITDSGFTGISLRDVHSNSRKNIGYQLEAINILPPIRSDRLEYSNSGECKSCGNPAIYIRGKFSGEDEYIIINNDMNFNDFNYTKEWFGIGQNANREIVISSEVVKAFKKFKVKKITLHPVHIINRSGRKLTPEFKPKPSDVKIMDYKSHFSGNLKSDLLK
jgi:hypothetical protein